MKTKEEIFKYFLETHGITISGFEKKELLDLQATFAGYDDMLREYPETKGFIKEISYNPHIRSNGQIDLSTGLSEVGKSGLRDYGTGVHETAHAIDSLRSKRIGASYATKAVELAKKNLKLRSNSVIYRDMVARIVGPVKNPKDYENPIEIFAYAIETSKGEVRIPLSDEIYRILKEELL